MTIKLPILSPAQRGIRALGALTLLLAAVGQAAAQTATSASITSLVTGTTIGVSSSTTVPGAGAPSAFSTGTNYNLTYEDATLSITSFTTGTGAGAVTYNPLAYGGTVSTTLVRFSSTLGTNQNNNIVYQRVTANTGTNYTLAGPNQPNEQDLFNSNNLNAGTDNLFANTGDGNGNNNNIERVDVVFDLGLTVTQALAFLVLERGATGAHDGFQIAAILSIDESGAPTAFGEKISFAANSYGDTDLLPSTTDWLVTRNNAGTPDGGAISPSADINNQAIGGTTIAVAASTANNGLGITVSGTIYGYSLFGYDVTGSGDALLDIADDAVYPKNTASSTGAGGIDLIAYTGVAVNASTVPEPGTVGLVALGGIALAALRRRRR